MRILVVVARSAGRTPACSDPQTTKWVNLFNYDGRADDVQFIGLDDKCWRFSNAGIRCPIILCGPLGISDQQSKSQVATMKCSANQWMRVLGVSAIAVGAIVSTGCQIDVAGQTLPSPNYQYDDIQIYQQGPEFKLQNEADAMKAYKAEQQLGI